MRLPIPVVILLSLAVVGGVWFTNTWSMDFLTPPTEARLEEVRAEAEASLPRAVAMDDAISVPAAISPPPPTPAPPRPSLDLGDLSKTPELDDYAEFATEGADHLISLARALETRGEFQRALLAWERVIDSTKPDGGQAITAISSIKRLRPTLADWNPEPEQAAIIELHAGTGKDLAKALAPILEGVARELEQASSGIVRVESFVAAGENIDASDAPVPVALWLTGPGKDAVSTDVLSFTVESPEVLQEEVSTTAFRLIRSFLRRSTTHRPPGGLGEGETPFDALSRRVTRLGWSELAKSLNAPPKKDE